jgi:predicted RNase H-like HicB family nuclease
MRTWFAASELARPPDRWCVPTNRTTESSVTIVAVGFDDYKVVLYRNQPDGWVAEIPAIPGCHALMSTREDALAQLADVFRLISEEYGDRKEPLPADTTEIFSAWNAANHVRETR